MQATRGWKTTWGSVNKRSHERWWSSELKLDSMWVWTGHVTGETWWTRLGSGYLLTENRIAFEERIKITLRYWVWVTGKYNSVLLQEKDYCIVVTADLPMGSPSSSASSSLSQIQPQVCMASVHWLGVSICIWLSGTCWASPRAEMLGSSLEAHYGINNSVRP